MLTFLAMNCTVLHVSYKKALQKRRPLLCQCIFKESCTYSSYCTKFCHRRTMVSAGVDVHWSHS